MATTGHFVTGPHGNQVNQKEALSRETYERIGQDKIRNACLTSIPSPCSIPSFSEDRWLPLTWIFYRPTEERPNDPGIFCRRSNNQRLIRIKMITRTIIPACLPNPERTGTVAGKQGNNELPSFETCNPKLSSRASLWAATIWYKKLHTRRSTSYLKNRVHGSKKIETIQARSKHKKHFCKTICRETGRLKSANGASVRQDICK